MGVRIQTGDSERIWVLALDASLDPLTGVTDLLISISRKSDGFWLDWNDYTFKSSGWTTREAAMTQFSATNAPGEYYADFNTASIVSPATDDTYQVYVRQSPGATVANIPQVGEIKVGHFVDDLDAAVSSRAAPGDAMDLVTDAVDASAVAASGANEIRDSILSDATPFAGANVDAAVSSRATQADILSDATPFAGADIDQSLSATEANIRGADGDDLKDISDQIDALPTAAVVSTEVWSEPLPGAFGAGEAGKLVGDNVDAAISSRATQADILSDATPFAGANVDAAVSSRAAPGDAMDLVTDAVDASAVAASGANEIRDTILSDSTPFAGANVDAAVSSRAAPGDAMDLVTDAVDASAVAASGANEIRDTILSDSTPFAGANVDAAISTRATQADILSDATPFAGANVDAAVSSVVDRLDELVIAAETAAVAGSSTTEIRTGLTQADGFFDDMVVFVVNAAGVAARNVDGYLQTNGAITVAALPFTPAALDKVFVLARTGSVPVDVSAIVAGIWGELLPGGYGAGEAGKLVGDNVDAAVSSRATQADILSDATPFAGADIDQSLSATEANIRGGTGTGSTLEGLAGAGYDSGDSLKAADDARVVIEGKIDDISAVTRFRTSAPSPFEVPLAGSVAYKINVNLEDTQGNPEDPDSDTITVGVTNQVGTDRSANLSSTTMTKLSVGRYEVAYTVASTHPLEQLMFTFTYLENTIQFVKDMSRLVTDSAEAGYTATDRARDDQIAIETAAIDGRLPADPADQSDVEAAITASETAIRGADGDDLKDISDQIDALPVPPTAAVVSTEVWSEPLPGAFGAGEAGKLVGDNVDAKVSTRATQADILSDATPFAGANVDAAISSRSSHSAADVDSALTASHGAGSWQGATAAAIATQVWSEALPGAFAAGTAGYILGTNLDAAVSSVITAIGGLNNLSIVDVQTALTNQGYTTVRAALLDNLDAAISSVVTAIGALNNLSIADVQAALDNQGYTAARAPNLDNLDTAVSAVLTAAEIAKALVHDNTVVDNQAYTTIQGRYLMTGARIRNYDAKANALAAGATGLLYTFTWTATYDAQGRCTNLTGVREP